MTEPKCRPFRMSDAMILIAATAIGFAEARGLLVDHDASRLPTMYLAALSLATTLLPAWSIAFLVIRLRRPRPSLVLLWRQPGAIACLMSAIPTVFLHLLYLLLKVPGMAADGPLLPYLISFMAGGFSVSAAWSVQKPDHGWNSEPGWIDRGGIVLGSLWVFFFGLFCLACFFPVAMR